MPSLSLRVEKDLSVADKSKTLHHTPPPHEPVPAPSSSPSAAKAGSATKTGPSPQEKPSQKKTKKTSAKTGAAPAIKKRKPVILQILPELNTGGVERGTVEMTEAIVKAEAVALVASAGGALVHDVQRFGGRHFELPLKTKNILRMRANARRLRRLIREQEVDLVHARSRAPAWSALWAARATGRPFVTTFHGTYNINAPLKRFYNSVMTRGDRVIAISDFIAQHIRDHYQIDESVLRIVPRGVDMAIFDPERTTASRMVSLAEKWRLPDGVPVIMLPGRLTGWKGQTVLIEALAKLGRQDVRCLLLGSDQGRVRYRQKLDALIQKHNLGAVVHILEDCKDMPAAYMLADIVVSASTDPEGFGRVMAEGQAMGKPVIASDHGGAKEILLPDTGWLVPPGDPAALAEALDTALRLTIPARETLAKKAIANVKNRFTKDLMCERTLDVYEDLLKDYWSTKPPKDEGKAR